MPKRSSSATTKDDVEWRERVDSFFETLEVWGDAEIWADDRIDAGAKWYPDIKQAIGRSAVAVLLLSKDFLRTEFIAKQEIPELLARREQLGMKLIPLLIHDCPWKAVRWLRELNIVPSEATPLATLSEAEQNTFLSELVVETGAFLETWTETAIPPGQSHQIVGGDFGS